jgi:hypothetical protein
VESTLRESGSGKLGEFELCEIVSMLNYYASAEKNSRNLVDVEVKEGEEEKKDSSVLAHELLLFVEKLINFLIDAKIKYEKRPSKYHFVEK